MSSAYLLVSHGSRDPRPAIAMQQLALLVHARPRYDDGVLVGTAYLELSPQQLHEQIEQFAKSAIKIGCDRLKIIPLFLLPGVHVMEDIPSQVDMSRHLLGQDIMIKLQPYLGSHPGLVNLFKQDHKKATGRILLAHGSRREMSHQRVEELAASLEAVAAYWAVPHSLESRVQELVVAGHREIVILPYFLFAGGITDAIAERVEELKLQSPGVCFHLGEPLGVREELVELIWELMEE